MTGKNQFNGIRLSRTNAFGKPKRHSAIRLSETTVKNKANLFRITPCKNE